MRKNKLAENLRRHGYIPLRLLGKGNFSEVYLVQNSAGSCFACKISRSVELLRREAYAMEGLTHPLFPESVEYWQEDEGYLVMEYVAGSTLEEMAGRRDGFSAEYTVQMGLELAGGLGFLHEHKGMVYRDVKPANIIVCQNGRIRLVDFGCVCLLGEKPRSKAGTPGFAAPEQMRGGEKLTAACDVYGLGRTMDSVLCEREKKRKLRKVLAACTQEEQERRLPDMRSVVKALEQTKKRKERGSREVGWERDFMENRIQVRKNIWESRYKNP